MATLSVFLIAAIGGLFGGGLATVLVMWIVFDDRKGGR